MGRAGPEVEGKGSEPERMLLRFFTCLGEPQGSKTPWLGHKFCNFGSLEGFPATGALAPFCFPLEGEIDTAKRLPFEEEYSFTMTGGEGEHVHAFCRRVYPVSSKGKGTRYPVVLCIMSEELWGNMFFKVLEVLEQLLEQQQLLTSTAHEKLPAATSAAWFLRFLGLQLSSNHRPGQVLRIPFPNIQNPLRISAATRIPALNEMVNEPLQCTDEFIELQVPPWCGCDQSISGVSVVRLVWRIPVPCLMTLLAGLLLERRILLVSRDKEVLSSAVHGASALIYPFKWHHVYLPIVPESLKEYVMAPMPFLIGMPAELLPSVRGLQMSEVTVVDLDLGRCEPAPGSDGDDAQVLPLREKLEASIRDVVKKVHSKREYEGNQLIMGIMTDYFVQLFKGYRRFMRRLPDDHALDLSGERGHSRSRSMVDSSDTLRGDHHCFDFPAFVQSRRKGDVRQFLALFRQSQMFEMMIQDRLEGADNMDQFEHCAFENKISLVDQSEPRGMSSLRKPVRSLSKTLSLRRSKKRLMISMSDSGKRALPASMVSDLAPDALKTAVSEEGVIHLPSSSHIHHKPSHSTSSVLSELQIDADLLGEVKESTSVAEPVNGVPSGVTQEPQLEDIMDLINLDGPILGGSSSEAQKQQLQKRDPHPGDFEDNAFGEPAAFPTSLSMRHSAAFTVSDSAASADVDGLNFSDSEKWEDAGRINYLAPGLQSASGSGSLIASSTDEYSVSRKGSAGMVASESVQWSRLMDGLAGSIKETQDENKESQDGTAGFNAPQQQSQTVEVAGSSSSPFLEPAHDGGSCVMDSSGDALQQQSPLTKRLSRVDSLRVQSQKQLDEMFASNLRVFDITTSAAAHPGAVPWILPRHPVKNSPFPGMRQKHQPMAEKHT